jgi:hypothetical protein
MKAGNIPSLENCDEREVELQDFVLGVAVGANARIRAQVNRRAMMLKSRIGVLLFVFGCCFTAHAQQGQFGNQPSYYSSPQDVQDRINELSKQSVIPKSELALSRELDHIDNEIFSANTELSKSANYKEWGKRLEELVGKIKTTQSALLKIDCQKTGEFLQAERDYYIAVSSLRSFMQSYPQLNTEALLPSRAGAMS